MDYSKIDDENLIELIVRANQDALSELYDRYGRLVYSLAIKTIGEPTLAEEITQDVFLRIWEKAYTYRADQAKVSTWLTSIARHRTIDMLRRRGVRPEANSIPWPELSSDTIPNADGCTPEEITEQVIRGGRVKEAIATLPSEQQKALVLAYFYGYTQSQIAELLEEPLGTIKTRIRLAMQKLRQLFEEQRFNV